MLTTPQDEKFAMLMAKGLTPTKAYIKAGYSARGAHAGAWRLLQNADVALRVGELRMAIAKEVTSGIVRQRIAEINERLWQIRWGRLGRLLHQCPAQRDPKAGCRGG
jgi:phage terminase small subunit